MKFGLSIFFPLAFICVSHAQKSSNIGCISLLYSGDQTKPYPRIILYLENSFDIKNDTIYSDKLKIPLDKFEKVRSIIEKRYYSSNDSLLENLNQFQFTISYNGETTIILTPYYSRIRAILESVSVELDPVQGNVNITYEIESILSRLRYDNNLIRRKNVNSKN